MTRLEELIPGSRVGGLIANEEVTILHAQWHASSAVTLHYRDDAGRVGQEMVHRDQEHRLVKQPARGRWGREGVDVIPRGPYSPVPALDELPADVWDRPSPLRGIRFDRADQVRRLRALEQRLREFQPPPGFKLWNRFYEAFDTEVLWAVLRELRPRRVVELGSGWSSLVIAAALEANGNDAIYESYDPFPCDPAPTTVRRVPAQEVPEETFAALGEHDVLFVDTTHTVKIGGDVNRIVLDVLPMLAPGVVVHFHDVLLPWEMHRHWLERGWFWCEQYLLQAFLCGNRDWEVVLGLQDLTRTQPELVRQLVPSWQGNSYPSAFWIRRVT